MTNMMPRSGKLPHRSKVLNKKKELGGSISHLHHSHYAHSGGNVNHLKESLSKFSLKPKKKIKFLKKILYFLIYKNLITNCLIKYLN